MRLLSRSRGGRSGRDPTNAEPGRGLMLALAPSGPLWLDRTSVPAGVADTFRQRSRCVDGCHTSVPNLAQNARTLRRR